MPRMSEKRRKILSEKANARAACRKAGEVTIIQDKRVKVKVERGNKIESVLVRVNFTKADEQWLRRHLTQVDSCHVGEILRRRFKLRRYHKLLDHTRITTKVRFIMERNGFVSTKEEVPMMGCSYVVYRRPDRYEALL